MRAFKIEVAGYKRFKEATSMDVAGKLTAIVGPNEAGKTSFLRAIEHLGNESPFSPRELSRDWDGEHFVRAYFKLDAADREALAGVHGGEVIDEFRFRRLQDGTHRSQVVPSPTRDLGPRQALRLQFEKVTKTKWFQEFDPEVDAEIEDPENHTGDALRALVESVVAILGEESETLSETQLSELELIQSRLSYIDDLKTLKDAVAALEDHIEIERAEEPSAQARGVLSGRLPEFLFFDAESREIPDVWDFGTDPPQGLKNLCELAGLDFDALREAVQNADAARRDELVVAANDRLAEFFSQSWGQSKVSVRLSVNHSAEGSSLLEVHASSQQYKYQQLSLRSEGLRQFIALVAFIEIRSHRSDVPKVLLIDEADMHLHYDAQADLVRVLTTQPVAQKVIYSTHSAGCLPADLGTGVRLIEQMEAEGSEGESGESRVENWFWTSSRTGFSPLLIGMGASNFAFSATRFALMTEGITDMMMLPTLFCEAAGLEYLQFQCVPGLSETTKSTAEHFESTAAKVTYLVDGDDGGEKIRKQLIEDGKVDESFIFDLKTDSEELETEDLIRKDVYLEAVNSVLADMRECGPIPADQVPDVGRVDAVDLWVEQQGEPKLSKRSVAERVLDLRNESGILDPGRAEFVSEKLHEIQTALGIDPTGSEE
ncbi:MAG: AAA family ATPase [Solirubrobacterales bacterium]